MEGTVPQEAVKGDGHVEGRDLRPAARMSTAPDPWAGGPGTQGGRTVSGSGWVAPARARFRAHTQWVRSWGHKGLLLREGTARTPV